MNRSVLAALLSAALFAPLLRAEEPAAKPSQGSFAVLIGVGQFDDPAIKARPTAEADAKAMYDLVTDGKHIGIPADRVALLTSTPDEKRKGKKATKENILKAIHRSEEHTSELQSQ